MHSAYGQHFVLFDNNLSRSQGTAIIMDSGWTNDVGINVQSRYAYGMKYMIYRSTDGDSDIPVVTNARIDGYDSGMKEGL